MRAAIIACYLVGVTANAEAETPSAYVSDRFQKVAKRLGTEVGLAALASVCTDRAALCEPIVKTLTGAFRAAIDGDNAQLENALKRLLIDIAGNVATQVVLGDLANDSADAELASVVDALAPCIANVLARGSNDCAIPIEYAKFLCEGKPIQDASTALCWIAERARGTVQQPGSRGDAVVYIQQLRALIDFGFDDGVFSAVQGFLSKRMLLSAEFDLLNYPVAPHARGLWADTDETLMQCAIYKQWVSSRSHVLNEMRYALIKGTKIDLSLLEGLAENECSGEAADNIRRRARYQTGPLKFAAFARDWGLLLLSGAALIDFVRTGDSVQLADALYSTVEYLVAEQVAASLRTNHAGADNDFSSIDQISAEDVRNSCEILKIRKSLGKPFSAPKDGSCYSLVGRTKSNIDLHDSVALGATNGVSYSALASFAGFVDLVGREKQLDSRKALGWLLENRPTDLVDALAYLNSYPSDQAMRTKLNRLAHQFIVDPKLGKTSVEPDDFIRKWSEDFAETHQTYVTLPSEPHKDVDRLRAIADLARLLAPTSWRDRVYVPELQRMFRAIESVLRGRSWDLEAAVIQAGTKLLITELQQRTLLLLTGNESAECSDDRHRLLFCGLFSDSCAAGALIGATIGPIVEHFSAGGGNTVLLAQKIHMTALRSPFLDRSPFIANIGLGFSGVFFLADDDDFVAMTLLDKLGIAIYKYLGDRWQFETGIFVGGFLDALVRVLADEEHKYWLGGLAVGFPKMAGMPIGLEAHVAAALPFELSGTKEDIGLTAGAAIVLPWSFVFNEKED